MRILSALAAALLTPALLGAQVRPSAARPATTEQRSAGVTAGRACELVTGDGLVLPFAVCPPPGEASAGKEVEIVEYRNGDAPQRVTRVTVRGVVHRDLVVRRLGLANAEVEADGRQAPADGVSRARPGRVKVGRVTLRRSDLAGSGRTAVPWGPGDSDEDGFPLTIDLQGPAGSVTTISFAGCQPASRADIDAEVVTLTCREVRTVPALDANPYARFIAREEGRPEAQGTLLQRRPIPTGAASPAARAGHEPRVSRLIGARLEGWSLDFDEARSGEGRWTLEVRVDRIEMS